MPELDQVPGRERGTLDLVDPDDEPGGLPGGLQDGERDRDVELVDRVDHLAVGRDHHERLDRLIEKELEARNRRVAVDSRGRHERVVPELARRGLDGEHAARRPVLRDSRGQHADRVGPARDEGTCGEVAPVAELGDRGEYPSAGLGPDVGVVVEHARHGDVRDAGDRRDVVHVGRTLGHGAIMATASGGRMVAGCYRSLF